MNRRRYIWLGLTSLGGLGAWSAIHAAFSADMARARARLEGMSTVFNSRFGQMEYAVAGQGPPCMMIHGTGGGFDQGLAFARPLIVAGWRIVSPSRFGYLRSTNPQDPSLENQADALADLLDELGFARLPVIGGSAGALSALQFAIRHPDRCSALVAVVPATFVPGRSPQPPGMIAQAIMEYGLKSDFLFWAGTKLAKDEMIAALLATDPDIVRGASASEQARVSSILQDILPVSMRSAGLANDAIQAGTPQPMPIEKITVPTLAISLEDDRFGTAAAARHIANTVKDAQLIIYPSGGHIWVGHDRELFEAIDTFLKAT
jgi:pimeloyl-ACP methyl ester carboxylesterase